MAILVPPTTEAISDTPDEKTTGPAKTQKRERDTFPAMTKPAISAISALPAQISPISLHTLNLRDLERSDVVASLNRYLIIRLRRRFSELGAADAEDIAAEALSKITRWERPIRDLASLALAIALRAAFRHFRRNRIVIADVLDGEGDLDDFFAAAGAGDGSSSSGGRDNIDKEALRLVLDDALQRLIPEQQQLIRLRADGYTLKEMADILGQHPSMVNRNLERARLRLREYLIGAISE